MIPSWQRVLLALMSQVAVGSGLFHYLAPLYYLLKVWDD
jgi:hypothetical protein